MTSLDYIQTGYEDAREARNESFRHYGFALHLYQQGRLLWERDENMIKSTKADGSPKSVRIS